MIRRYPARFCFSFAALLTIAGILSCPTFGYAQAAATNDAATGRLTGQVSNGATRALLEGAAVEIPALGRRTLTDTFGRFVFEGLPAGSHPEAPKDVLYTVTEIYPEHVVLDGNHPLAGIAIRLHLKVEAVREATEEEIGRGSTGTGFFKVQPQAPGNGLLH